MINIGTVCFIAALPARCTTSPRRARCSVSRTPWPASSAGRRQGQLPRPEHGRHGDGQCYAADVDASSPSRWCRATSSQRISWARSSGWPRAQGASLQGKPSWPRGVGSSSDVHQGRDRHRRHVHRSRRRRRGDGPLVRREGAVEPGQPGGAVAAALESAAFDAAEVEHVVVGTTIGINAVLTRARRARRLPDDARLRGHPVHPAHQPQAPLRLQLAQAHADGAPARLRRRRRSGWTRRGACSSRSTSRRCERAARGRAGRTSGVAVAVCYLFSLPQPRARARRRASCCAERLPERAGLALARGGADLARVRARHDDDRRRVPQAADRALRRRRLDQALDEQGVGGPLVAAEVERRPRAGARGARAPGRTCCSRASPAARSAARYVRARAAARATASRWTWAARAATSAWCVGRRAALRLRLRDRVRPAGQRAERLDAHHRRGRRLDRLGRPRRLPAGRPAERGRRSRAGLLRPRRRGARRSRTRTSCSAASIPATSSAGGCRSTPALARGGARRGSASALGLRRVETASAMLRVANENMANAIRIVTVEQGIDPRELRAGRLRRRRADARRGDRRRDRHARASRAAAPGRLLGVRRARRAACASTRCAASS